MIVGGTLNFFTIQSNLDKMTGGDITDDMTSKITLSTTALLLLLGTRLDTRTFYYNLTRTQL